MQVGTCKVQIKHKYKTVESKFFVAPGKGTTFLPDIEPLNFPSVK